MNNREFLGLALPQEGHYCLFHKADGYPQHEWFDSIDDLADACEAHEATTDLYFGTAAFASPTERTQANVLALRCLATSVAVASLIWRFLLEPSVGLLPNIPFFADLFPVAKDPDPVSADAALGDLAADRVAGLEAAQVLPQALPAAEQDG